MEYRIGFRKFKKNCADNTVSGIYSCTHENHVDIDKPFSIDHMSRNYRCTEKLCPVLKTLKQIGSD